MMQLAVKARLIDALVRERVGETREVTNRAEVVASRAIAMYLMRGAGHSLPQIGRYYRAVGRPHGMHHTTVFHHVTRIARLRVTDTELGQLLTTLEEALATVAIESTPVQQRRSVRESAMRQMIREEVAAALGQAQATAQAGAAC